VDVKENHMDKDVMTKLGDAYAEVQEANAKHSIGESR